MTRTYRADLEFHEMTLRVNNEPEHMVSLEFFGDFSVSTMYLHERDLRHIIEVLQQAIEECGLESDPDSIENEFDI